MIKRSALTVGLSVLALAGAVVVAAPASAADLPDTYAAARTAPLSKAGTAYRSSIDDPKDQDWFRFNVTATTRAEVKLGDLPGDYTLTVFDGAGRQVGRSAYGGNRFERVIVSVKPGTYYARVSTQGYFAKKKQYQLRFRQLPAGLVTLDQHKPANDANGRVFATIYNNSSQWYWITDVDYAWYDKNKKLLRRDRGGMDYDLWIIPPGAVRPFGWVGNAAPKGATSVSVTPRGQVVKPSKAVPAVTVTGVKTAYTARKVNPFLRATGTASIAGSGNVSGVVIAETFNANGTLTGFNYWPVNRRGVKEKFEIDVVGPRPNTYRVYGLVGYGEPVQ